ncbi:PREDICTED: uncharacterized protein LOC105115824 isoform X1 [Populus euphratica]|uniref:Uncharacterized protein LOC105115824 isoform X1 n=1 Tax=Populus euphratica TaxID=75702 RepID=A0AAJ6TI22_POPEU|nr:PREDICTED: uncharacterized protein LOC105115824 isoform X1 [Populus euphratica]
MASGLPLRHPAHGFNASQQLIKSDRGSMLTMFNDNVLMKEIERTHAPDGLEVDVKPYLHLVEDILKRATQQIDTSLTTSQDHAEVEDKTQQINSVCIAIDQLSYTLKHNAYKELDGPDACGTTADSLRGTGWDRCPRNNCLTFQHARTLFLGCQAGAHLSSFCFELWRVLAACPDLFVKPVEVNSIQKVKEGSHQLSPSNHQPISRQPPAAGRFHTVGQKPPSHLKVEFSCFDFVYK